LKTRSSCGTVPTFEIVTSVLPDLIVPARVTFHSVRLMVGPSVGEDETAAADASGEAVGAVVAAADAGWADAGGAYVKFGAPRAAAQPVAVTARPAMAR
jgi:hypothetical protein